MKFFKKKYEKNAKCGKLAVECVSNCNISWKCLSAYLWGFLAENKIISWSCRTWEKWWQVFFFQKNKQSHLFRRTNYKNGKAENRPMVADWIVFTFAHRSLPNAFTPGKISKNPEKLVWLRRNQSWQRCRKHFANSRRTFVKLYFYRSKYFSAKFHMDA